MTSSSVYCFVAGGSIRCVPVSAFTDTPGSLGPAPEIVVSPTVALEDNPTLKIRNKNLLYTLNNPSLSDLESDAADSSYSSDDIVINDLLNNYSTHALFLPDYSIDLPDNLSDNYSQIKVLLKKVFAKTWSDKDSIDVKRLTGGITNMLLCCTYTPTNEKVLMRVYGQGTSLIIDRHREFISHLVLNSMNLAPPVHARFKNGLVYGFLEGRSLDPPELQNPNLYPLIAQQLGNWHMKVLREQVYTGVNQLRDYTRALKRRSLDKSREHRDSSTKREKKPKKKSIDDIWDLIEDWINIVPLIPELVASFKENSSQPIDEDNIRESIKNEFVWLRETTTSTINSPAVSAHCDLLSGNVIIPEDSLLNKTFTSLPLLKDNPVKFIDYEYMLPAPRAFDIANHFAEWQGFNCDSSAIPEPSRDNPVMVKWVKCYLNDLDASDTKVGTLIDEIACYYGLPGFYWGIWAMIQSEISNIDFDYSKYGQLRLREYWDWKKDFTM